MFEAWKLQKNYNQKVRHLGFHAPICSDFFFYLKVTRYPKNV